MTALSGQSRVPARRLWKASGFLPVKGRSQVSGHVSGRSQSTEVNTLWEELRTRTGSISYFAV